MRGSLPSAPPQAQSRSEQETRARASAKVCASHFFSAVSKRVAVVCTQDAPQTLFAPSPLVGEGWGGGWRIFRCQVPCLTTPTPNPSPQGGGERTERSKTGTLFSMITLPDGGRERAGGEARPRGRTGAR